MTSPSRAPRQTHAERREFGDFQTPTSLAAAVCRTLRRWRVRPATVIEPTCGRGAFLAAAHAAWPDAGLVGYDVNPAHLDAARTAVPHATVAHADFFATDWSATLADLPTPWLVLGNPPWVTNAVLGGLDSKNRPERVNTARDRGIDAITGRSNFDVSEWITRECIRIASGRPVTIAMLLKTTVARRLLRDAWTRGLDVRDARIVRVDAVEHFRASVDAGLLFLRTGGRATTLAQEYDRLGGPALRQIGLADGELVADFEAWQTTRDLAAEGGPPWRSGVKHDCAAVLELRRRDGGLVNGLGERVDIEPTCVFPLIKSADLARETAAKPRRWILLPQQRLKDDPAVLAETAPKTWTYLNKHADRLDARRSRIYRNRPRFSVFGLGDYTFARHKVAVAGLYSSPRFHAIAPIGGRPVVPDDTVYLRACSSRRAAIDLAEELNGASAQAFFRARIFADAKRPVTAALLGRYGGTSKRDDDAVLGRDDVE